MAPLSVFMKNIALLSLLVVLLVGAVWGIGFAAMFAKGLEWFQRATIIDPLFTSSELDVAELEASYREYLAAIPNSIHSNYPSAVISSIGTVTEAQEAFFANPAEKTASNLIEEYKKAQEQYESFFRNQRRRIQTVFSNWPDTVFASLTGEVFLNKENVERAYDDILQNAQELKREIERRDCLIHPSVSCVVRPGVWRVALSMRDTRPFYSVADAVKKNDKVFSYETLANAAPKGYLGQQGSGPYFAQTRCFSGDATLEPFYVEGQHAIKWGGDNFYGSFEIFKNALKSDEPFILSETADYLCPDSVYHLFVFTADTLRESLRRADSPTQEERAFLQTLDWRDAGPIAKQYKRVLASTQADRLRNVPQLARYHSIVNKLDSVPRALRFYVLFHRAYYQLNALAILNDVATGKLSDAEADKRYESIKNNVSVILARSDVALFSFSYSSAFWRITAPVQFGETTEGTIRNDSLTRLSDVENDTKFLRRVQNVRALIAERAAQYQ